MKYLCILILLGTIFSCTSSDKQKSEQATEISSPPLLNNITVETFKNDSVMGGFGYNILVDGKIMVHQPNIPAVMGNRGFASADDAAKTANLVAFKLKNNIMPPSVTTTELDSIGIK